MTLVQTEPKKLYIRVDVPDYLCFTANTANSRVTLAKNGSPTDVTLETSTDRETWSTYTFGTQIILSNIGDKVYFRNTSTTTTTFGTSTSDYYKFTLSGNINASGDITFLVNKNGTKTLSGDYCFYKLFWNSSANTVLKTPPLLPATTLSSRCYSAMFYYCTGLTEAPALPATTLGTYCYASMFYGCSNLETLPKLPATTLKNYCYQYMFDACSKIKLSSTQTGEYQTAYRIPTTGTGTTATNALQYIFRGTGGTFTSDPSINTTYYTSNTLV